jgi:MerR family transcriptional regulator, thiopeptide resistance regulator
MRTVGEVSKLSGVSVRALHHYDEIGLLSPSERSDAGYRLYSHADLQRLQETLGWRALGFGLGEIAPLLDEPGRDRGAALRRQPELVEAELGRLGALVRALDRALAAHELATEQEEQSMFAGFDHAQYEDEARERWGDTDAYRESARRAAGYGAEEWAVIRATYERVAPGLAQYVHDAVAAGADALRR